jgi:hypothetical protein
MGSASGGREDEGGREARGGKLRAHGLLPSWLGGGRKGTGGGDQDDVEVARTAAGAPAAAAAAAKKEEVRGAGGAGCCWADRAVPKVEALNMSQRLTREAAVQVGLSGMVGWVLVMGLDWVGDEAQWRGFVFARI